MSKMLIATADMEVGGVERSLISMLHQFDYKKHQIDLMLYSHTGDFMNLLPHQATLLPEIKDYSTFRMSIGKVLQLGKLPIGLARMIAKCQASLGKSSENGYKQLQYMWKYALPFLPKMQKQYDVAISYLWPHYFVAAKVEAKTKLAWIHTDYSVVDTDIQMDIQMWREFDYLVAVSEACKCAFIKQYPTLKDKVIVMENIMAPEVVRNLANESIHYSIRHDDRFKVITVARLSYAKGIDQAVKALKILKTRGYHDIVWYIVGYGGDEKMIRKLIMQYDLEDSFILLGKQINPYPLMKEADVYVQPSRYEGKAVTVGEAQILAKPVLITNYPTAQSQVKDGVDGVICGLSVSGIAEGVEKLYQDVRLREKLIHTCVHKDFCNQEELEKLYALV